LTWRAKRTGGRSELTEPNLWHCCNLIQIVHCRNARRWYSLSLFASTSFAMIWGLCHVREDVPKEGRMKPRLNPYQVAPDTIKALSALEAQVQGSGLSFRFVPPVRAKAAVA
jgi:hypothetical protein